MILAGDVGGTHTRLALCELVEGTPRVVAADVQSSRDHAGLEDLAAAFLARTGVPVTHACFGVAGPVKGNRTVTTNLPWVVDARTVASRLGLPAVWIINDLEALAWGLAAVPPERLAVLQAGQADPEGNQAVIAAGTGLGQAGLVWDGRGRRPFATEGGHADFAPTDDTQADLCRFLRQEFGHVSVERVLSGHGLHHIYRFLRDTGRAPEPAWLADAIREGDDPAAVISQAGLARTAALAGLALDVFVAAYGAEAGNLALRTLATGGVFVGGGIAPRIVARLREAAFLEAFRAKGRLRPLLEAVPVTLVLDERAAILGAARVAALRAGAP